MALVSSPPLLQAATNAATGGIGGNNNGTLTGGDGSGNARIDLFSIDLALVKQARDLLGTVLANGSNVSPGQEIYFVLYVDNPTVADATSQITDALNEVEFTYVNDSIEIATVPSGSNDTAIWAAAWAPITDVIGVPDDVASFVDTGGLAEKDSLTIGNVSGQANQIFTIPAASLRAIRFRVRVD